MQAPRSPLVVPVLVVAISAISGAAVLVRLVPDLPAPTVAFWRCLLVALVLLPTVAIDWKRRMSARDLVMTAFAGLALALHFWTWFESLRHTSVLRSTVLVCLSPVWAALIEGVVLRFRPSGRYWLGLLLALGGVLTMAMAGGAGAAASLHGDLLALVGGGLAATYMVTGRAVRQRVGIGPYGALVCSSAAMWLLPVLVFVLPSAELAGWHYPGSTWGVLLAMAAGPQLLGHIGLNYAVRYLPAAVVSLVVLLEPAGAAVLAGLVLGEWASPQEWAGAAVILLGVALATAPWPGRR